MAARQAYYQKALTIARHGLCYAYAYGYGYMPMIIIHCELDRGICAHRINKTCFVTQPRHRRLAWLDSGLRLCMTMSMTMSMSYDYDYDYDVCNVYVYDYGYAYAYAYAYGPSQVPVHAPKINLLCDYLRIRHCHLPYNYMTVSQTHSHSQPDPSADVMTAYVKQ